MQNIPLLENCVFLYRVRNDYFNLTWKWHTPILATVQQPSCNLLPTFRCSCFALQTCCCLWWVKFVNRVESFQIKWKIQSSDHWSSRLDFITLYKQIKLRFLTSGEERQFELNVKVAYAPPRKLRFLTSGEKNASHFSHNPLTLSDIQFDPAAWVPNQ